MKKLGVGVIGCGSWGKNHARIYHDLTYADLKAVSDVDEQVAKAIGEKFGVDSYTSADKIFERNDIEAVSICTPTVTHADITLHALAAGKHTLVEKPMANSIAEANKIISSANQNHRYLMIGFVERFNPAVTAAINVVSSNEIGEVILANARRVSRRPQRIGDVGIVKDLAIHDIDVALQLFKKESVQDVYAVAGSIAHKFEDYANITIRFRGNKNAFIETNWLTPRKIRRLIVTGTEGILNIEYIPQEITVENKQGSYSPFIDSNEPLRLELEHFITSILNDNPPTPSGEDGLKALQVCEAALKSALSHRPEKLRID
jgi:UDP-N-acetylglucosamine 3-dehydrogenase